MDPKIIYAIAQRDTIAGLFAMIRLKGEEASLKNIAEQYQKAYEDTPNHHVEWYLNRKLETPTPEPAPVEETQVPSH